ncbi:L,D-transpeptidase family protein [Plantactinospora sp. S1510]|uniref:L,D-transpeptidase family protein n=1 Tax=Plantactinospora alkalitolerans TaxID=2789879 RepID=A0ABS0GPG2_9ACTN|nr:Ig-like domain-containing protein [Plantactinospora alkalitolerans]MBF9128076.1 L,D-transpeptidase family protein [Plantactinospora alkalitolerans]
MGRNTRTWAMVIALAVVAPLGTAACGGEGGEKPQFGNGSGTTAGATATPTPPAEPLDFSVTPASGAKKQPVSVEIGTKITGGKIDSVSLTAAGGGTVKGSMREDGSSWVPAVPLKYSKTYTAKVTATTSTGQSETKTTSFTTMAKPRSVIGSGLYLFDDKTYGVAMPVVVEFSPGIAKKDRAKVQRRMFVESDPPQPGAWHWVSSGTQAYYRAPEYWKPGTTLTVRIGLEGIPLSNGKYGNVDRKATSKIGSKFEMKVDNKTKKMTVFENDKLVRTIPVSLGKKATPSSSGKMVVMEKKSSTVFDTRDDPDPSNRYVTEIDFAQRLTWGGEYIHAAPWSVGDQGRRNVSHGCVNVSTPNARWLFEKTKPGDPVTISGTERKLEPGNGWTAWNLSWKDFIKGSALPVPADLGT